MKIGILTFHFANGGGALLQALALQEKLKSLGNDVEIVDYTSEKWNGNYVKYKISPNDKNIPLKRKISISKELIINFFKYARRYDKTKEFKDNYIKISEKNIRNAEAFGELKFDAYVFGSDQIWNPNYTNDIDPIYFGKFDAGRKVLKVAYSASFGVSQLNEKQKDKIKRLIDNLDYIGVREKTGIKMLRELSDRNIVNTLDPALLYDTIFWDRYKRDIKVPENYLLLYQLVSNKTMKKAAYKIAREMKLKVIEVRERVYNVKDSITNPLVVSPDELISYIKQASFVVTDSFHGTVFSVIYKKNFYTFKREQTSVRMSDLLKLLGLQNRMIDSANDIKYNEKIRYDKVYKRLKEEQKISNAFLEKVFKE